MSAPRWHDYDYAVVRVVPRVDLGFFVNVGVVLHARTAGYLGLRLTDDLGAVARHCPTSLPVAAVQRHLRAYATIAEGGPAGGPIGLLPPSERFHWLTAPRSAVLQTSPLHAGRTGDPAKTLDLLFGRLPL